MSQQPPKNLIHGALIEAEILTSPPQCICSTWPSFWAPALCSLVCQHLPSDVEMFLCVSGTCKKKLEYGSLMKAEILTSPLPHLFAQISLVFGHWHCACRCINTSQVVLNISMCLRNLKAKFGAWGPNRN